MIGEYYRLASGKFARMVEISGKHGQIYELLGTRKQIVTSNEFPGVRKLSGALAEAVALVDQDWTYAIKVNRHNGWHVQVKELPDCISQGETYEEALFRIIDTTILWILTALGDGQKIPVPEEHYQAG